MGSYGIGPARAMAALAEQNADENGINWPAEIAPYQIAIAIISMKDEKQVEIAEKIYNDLSNLGYEVILDDRDERPGVKFKDMDLIGIPVRIVVGEKNLPNVEVKLRAETEAKLVPAEEAAKTAEKIVREELAKLLK
jgi:prolyl-tRNA synthetase